MSSHQLTPATGVMYCMAPKKQTAQRDLNDRVTGLAGLAWHLVVLHHKSLGETGKAKITHTKPGTRTHARLGGTGDRFVQAGPDRLGTGATRSGGLSVQVGSKLACTVPSCTTGEGARYVCVPA